MNQQTNQQTNEIIQPRQAGKTKHPILTTPLEPFNPKLRKQTYLEICVDDALYNRPYEEIMHHHKGSEFAGWGLTRPQSRLVSYQRLWEYYVNMEIYRDALAYDHNSTRGNTHEHIT